MILSVLSLRAQEMYMNLFQIEQQQICDKPLLLNVSFTAEYQDNTKASLVLSAKSGDKTVFWDSFALEHDFHLTKKIPSHLLNSAKLQCYVYNPKKDILKISDFDYSLTDAEVPSFLPENVQIEECEAKILASYGNSLYLDYYENKYLELGDENGPLTAPVSLYLNDSQYFEWDVDRVGRNAVSFVNENRQARTVINVSYSDESPTVHFDVSAKFFEETEVSRFAMLLPFVNGRFVVYRQNMHVDSVNLQDEYYLDHEGFSLRNDETQLNLYHPQSLSSVQLDVKNSTAVLNIDYEKDHPLIHYPTRIDTLEHYVDISKRKIRPGDVLTASFDLSLTQVVDLPRFMPVWEGYESAFIFTEHADWTDIRTHRAVCFGSEDVTSADDAVGGFVYYDVPVTKSVFYSNPNGVINLLKNRRFPDMHSTIRTDTVFFDFLKQLKDKGFEICLHTPEQYTTTRPDLWEALAFMKKNFGSPSWIDHGYNNTYVNNREDLVCDGLNPKSHYYALDAWKANGVRYLWNASYEEMRPFEEWMFSNGLQRPYPFWSDAFPKPRYMRPPFDEDLILWSTEYTLEPGEHWDYYLSRHNLDVVVESRSAFITHIYPAWVTTARGFWDMEDGKIVAKEGLNHALQRISDLRDRQLMLPTTVEKYLHYHELLQKIDYQYDNDGNVVLTNNNDETVNGFTLISKSPISVERSNGETLQTKQRESCGEYIIWFDFNPGEKIFLK